MKPLLVTICFLCTALYQLSYSELLRPSFAISWRKWNAATAISLAWMTGGEVLLSTTGRALAATSAIAPSSSEVVLKAYLNERYGTSLKYPFDWEEKTGTLSGDRTVVAFTCPDDKDTSVSLVFSPIPADYSKLTSFGGKDTIRQYLLPSGDGISTKVVDEYIKGESYFLEYVVRAELPGEIPVTRHVASVFALRPQESVVGLTIQTNENSYPVYQGVFSAVIPSFNVEQ